MPPLRLQLGMGSVRYLLSELYRVKAALMKVRPQNQRAAIEAEWKRKLAPALLCSNSGQEEETNKFAIRSLTRGIHCRRVRHWKLSGSERTIGAAAEETNSCNGMKA